MADARPHNRAPGQPPLGVDAEIAASCARQQGLIARPQARAVGLSWAAEERRVRSGRLYEVLPGVLSLTPTLSPTAWCAAAVLWSGGTLSHESLLHLHGLVERPTRIHVTVTGGGRPSIPEVQVHRTRGFAAGDITRVHGIRATTVARAALDIAPHTRPAVLRRIIHEAQYQRLIDPLSLDAVLRAHPGHPGLNALKAIDPGHARSESPLEDRLGVLLREVPGSPPVAQHWVRLSSGRRIRADFAYVEERLLVEADSRSAHARMLAFESDRERDNEALVDGWRTLRYASRMIDDRPGTISAEVTKALGRAG